MDVDRSCVVSIHNFLPPGELVEGTKGTVGIVLQGDNQSNNFFSASISNSRSNQNANITVESLNITHQEDGPWHPEDGEEELGPVLNQSKNYGANYTNVTHFDIYNDNGTIKNHSTIDYIEYLNLTQGIETGEWYTGRINVVSNCLEHPDSTFPDTFEGSSSRNANSTDTDYVNFKVANATDGGGDNVNGTDGGINDTGDTEAPPDPTNATNPGGNGTHPTDANETGGEGDPVEGDNDQPGQTPVPEPTPEPVPEPMLSLDIESKEPIYEARRGQFVSVNLTVTNEGEAALSEVSVLPQLERLEDWNVTDAQIANLDMNQTVHREILVRPPVSAEPGRYVIPLLGRNPDRELDVDYFNVEVTRDAVFEPRMSVVEVPRDIQVTQNTTTPLPALVENTGGVNLTNITARMQNVDDCGEITISDIDRVDVGERGSLSMSFEAGTQTQSCNTTLIVSSDQGTYSFADLSITVAPEEGLIPREYRVPFVAVAWTSILAAFAVFRRRYELDRAIFKAPFVLLVMGEALIFLYLVVDYYGLVSASFLPF